MKKFTEVFAELASRGARKKMIVAWGVDSHTIGAASKAVDLSLVDVVIVGDENKIKEQCAAEGIDPAKFTIVNNPDELPSVAQAVQMVREGQGDILMKGLCSTDKFMRAILNKEKGLLPEKAVLSHVSVVENPNYHKFIFFTDMAVIPAPEFKQKIAMTGYVVNVARAMGVAKPKVAFIAATEQMSFGMPACVDAAILAKMVDRGQIKGCIADGPLALDVAIDRESVEIKGLVSPVAGDADCLVFPNIESANVFWKTNSKLAVGVHQAGMVVGAKVPCVLASRADSIETKLNSIAMAAMAAK